MPPVSYTTSSADTAWIVWTENTSSNVTYSATLTWSEWNATGANVDYAVSAATQETFRESAERKQRARELLLGCLTRRQRREFEQDGYFHVETAKGRRRYRLAPGRAPLRVHGEDGSQWSYCIHPDGSFPPEDVVLAQKLMLETDEDAFLRIANASRAAVPA